MFTVQNLTGDFIQIYRKDRKSCGFILAFQHSRHRDISADCTVQINKTERQTLCLFERRMALAGEVAAYKRAHGLPVLDADREARVLASRRAMLRDPALAGACDRLFTQLMALSREAQTRVIEEGQPDA